MEGFEKKLYNRIFLVFAGIIGATEAIYYSNRFTKEVSVSEDLRGFIIGFQIGIGTCLLVAMVYAMIKYFSAIRNPDKLKKIYISETDERRLFIKQKTGGIGMNIVTYGLVVGTVAAGNINDSAFLTLLCASLFVVLVRGVLKLYYRNKY